VGHYRDNEGYTKVWYDAEGMDESINYFTV
jgi:hypothetical protein